MRETDKKLNRLTMKNILFIITFTVALVWVILHFNECIEAALMILGLCKPFIYGIMIAFVFHLPLSYFQRKLPKSIKGKTRNIVAAILALLVIVGLLTFIFWIVVPQVVDSVRSLIVTLPGYVEDVMGMLEQAISGKKIPSELVEQINEFGDGFVEAASNFVKEKLPQLLSMASGFANGIANTFMAVVIAVYLTVSKDRLIRQLKRALFAFCSEKKYHYLLHVGELVNKTFSSFLTGQLTEAIIIGVLCYIGCLVFRFPYAPILSVIIGCTNIIPIFGAIFGVAVSALLVAFVNPLQGVFFVIFGIVLQQFESNLIYPKVVGGSVGLSGLWVLFAITIGGGLFGFVGMLLGLPTFSVIYFLLREEINRRVALKTAGKPKSV